LSRCRHKRTHDRNDGAEGSFNSGEEEEQYSGEDQMSSLEEASPTSEHGYVAGSLDAAVNRSSNASPHTAPPANTTSLTQTQTFNSLQTLSMPMTMSQPHAINTGGLA
jgi:transcription factor STE12